VSNQVTLFEQETDAPINPKMQALAKAGVGMDLGDGIKGSYGIVGIKAGKFRLKYKGDETVLTNSDGTPVGYIDVVIVKANSFLNKQYFEGNYVEGVNAAPVCYSLDGVKPSDSSKTKQAMTCALCPKNQYGSKIGDNGTKQKACRDTKKLAVVPLADIRNQTMGGAMLFRVPPSSLKDLSVMADVLKGRGYTYNSVAVRISFDLQVSHPKPVFKALRRLDNSEVDAVLEMWESDSVARVLADNDVAVEHGEEAATPAAPVQPAGMPRPQVRDVPLMPTAAETAPRPQAPTRPPIMPPSLEEIARQMEAGEGIAVIQPATRGQAPVPVGVESAPRVLRVKPDDAAAPLSAATNPFAKAPPPVQAQVPAAAQAQVPAAANPFSPPPTVAKKTRAKAPAPVTVDVQAVEVADPPAPPSQLSSDIEDIVKGLGLDIE
jgi:hypothetical protein